MGASSATKTVGGDIAGHHQLIDKYITYALQGQYLKGD